MHDAREGLYSDVHVAQPIVDVLFDLAADELILVNSRRHRSSQQRYLETALVESLRRVTQWKGAPRYHSVVRLAATGQTDQLVTHTHGRLQILASRDCQMHEVLWVFIEHQLYIVVATIVVYRVARVARVSYLLAVHFGPVQI